MLYAVCFIAGASIVLYLAARANSYLRERRRTLTKEVIHQSKQIDLLTKIIERKRDRL